MGDKIESKKLAQAAGVNVVPGFLGDIASPPDDAVRIAGEIGYPVMMKASAGGGGKACASPGPKRRARRLRGAKREGLASFGDDRVFIEKFIESPRHIEIHCRRSARQHPLSGRARMLDPRRAPEGGGGSPLPSSRTRCALAMGEQAGRAGAERWAITAPVRSSLSSPRVPDRQELLLPRDEHALQVEHPVTEW
jgi:propionyl-CoA carboxylase alpha chain